MTLQPNKTHIAIVVGALVLLLFMIQLIVNANRTARHYESKLDEVQKETCYWLFQKRDVIKEKHTVALDNLESKYILFAKTQFENDWLRGTGDLSIIDEAKWSWASEIRWLEKQSASVREQIANCDKISKK